MTEKRMAQEFEIIQAVSIGSQEVVLGYAKEQKEGLHFMTAFCEQNELFAVYRDAALSNDYAEIVELFVQRVAEQASQVREQLQIEDKDAFQNKPVTPAVCKVRDGWHLVSGSDDLNGKVLVINPDVLKFEYQRATHQLVLCTGGFGASPNSRGSAVYCTNLYSGKPSRFERSDILATVDRDALPEWAEKGLKKIEHDRKEKQRGDAR